MLKTLEFEGFRGLKHLEVDGLARINLFTGRNNVGKTALLEGLFTLLGANNPAISFSLHVFRGLPRAVSNPDEVWGWLFHNKDMDTPIRMSCVDVEDLHSELTISLDRSARLLGTPESDIMPSGQTTGSIAPAALNLSYHSPQHTRLESRALMTLDGVKIEGAKEQPFPGSIFVPAAGRNHTQDAERFSSIAETVGAEEELLSVLRVIEPHLAQLSVYAGPMGTMLRADIGLGFLVPLPYLGDGFVHATSMLLAHMSASGGCVMVDEIDNGLHHSTLKEVWRGIASAARRFDVQVFATTHSRECVAMAHEALRDDSPSDLAVFRLERKNGETRAIRYDQKELETTLSLDWEMR